MKVDDRASGEAADSIVVVGCATGRFARRCMAIASAEIGLLAVVTCAIARGETATPPSNRVLRANMARLFEKKCMPVALSLAFLPDINDLRNTALILTSISSIDEFCACTGDG